jgi:hypothetical protein
MRTEIPCLASASRRSQSRPLMDSLESRTFLSTTPTIVHVGPKQAVKSLDAYTKWPKQGSSTAVKFLVDYSSTPYKLGHHAIWGNVTIEAADSSKKPTFQLEGVNYPTLYANGTLTVKNIKTVGGIHTILTGSTGNANVYVERVTMDAGAIYRGQGGNSATFKNNDILGKPYEYAYSNFTKTLKSCTIDNSGTSVPVQQGGVVTGGKPKGEAAIRFMNVNNLTMIGVKTKPFFYKSNTIWKQDVQLRPTGTLYKIVNCNFYIVDVGDMAWRKPALPLKEVQFINCTFAKMPHITSGVGTVKLQNCKVGGSTVNKTL